MSLQWKKLVFNVCLQSLLILEQILYHLITCIVFEWTRSNLKLLLALCLIVLPSPYACDIYLSLGILYQLQFQMAQEYFKSAEGGILVDVSCGSGLFSRKFAKSGTYSGVIALDFSENMLRQCYNFIESDGTLLTS